MKEKRGRTMPNDLMEIENELSSVLQEKHRVEEHITAIQEQILRNETWLTMNHPTTVDYQETLEELLALENYVGELQAQASCLNDVALELMLAREQWGNAELLLAS
jgi:predicted  nucleic acid-binding Zn-ribbon protein